MKTKLIFSFAFLTMTFFSCQKQEVINTKNKFQGLDGVTTSKSKELPTIKFESIKDIDGNVYKVVMIGTQKWMASNLNTSRYRNGDPIPEVKDPAQWSQLTTGAWCYYNNDPANGPIYGKLYNWYAVNDPRGLAPSCWHVPTNNEWSILSNHLGGDAVSGGPMKEQGLLHWASPNEGATNSSGFTALAGGYRFWDASFYAMWTNSLWWSSTAASPDAAFTCYITSGTHNLDRTTDVYKTGYNVRCVKN